METFKNYLKNNKQRLIKYKIAGSKAETAREWYSWYTDKWKREYPDIYNKRRLMPSYRSMYKRRPRRPIYIKRRRRLLKRKRASSPVAESKRRRFSPTTFGNRVGTVVSKWAETASGSNLNVRSRDLNVTEVTDLTKTTTNQINQRQRDIINLRGFKIRGHIVNDRNRDCTFHLCLLYAKDADTVSTTRFFRDYGQGTDRHRDFANGLSGFEFNTLGINTTEYTVLMHKRIKLAPATAADGFQSHVGKNYYDIDIWKPIKRQIEYDNATQTSCNTKLFMVWWMGYGAVASGTTPFTNAGTFNYTVNMCFREPKC